MSAFPFDVDMSWDEVVDAEMEKLELSENFWCERIEQENNGDMPRHPFHPSNGKRYPSVAHFQLELTRQNIAALAGEDMDNLYFRTLKRYYDRGLYFS